MKNRKIELVAKLRQTLRWRPEVEKTAASFAGVAVDEYEQLIRQLIETGDDKALGILLCVCGVNNVKLSPQVLAEALKVAEPVIDICFPYRVQGPAAIEPLLDVAQADDLSWERQALGATIAAELAVRHGSRHQIVKNVLQKLSQKIRAFEANLLIDQSLALLDEEPNNAPPYFWVTQQEVLKALPEEKPPLIIGGDFTVRRPIPKIGRNAPCPCGSGKKYKKCCYEKDQQLLRDASPYEGITMTQLRSMPSLVDDADMIREMRAYELKKLQPANLNEDQLYQAYRRADHFGMREFAYDMLLELKDRPDRENFALEHMEDLLDSALDVGDIDLARKVMDLIPPEGLHDAEAVKFRFDLVENREHYDALEARCRQALQEEADEDLFKWDYALLALSYSFENIFPAMSIVFARAAVIGRQEAFFDNEMLVEVIRKCRADLGHNPWEDPLEDIFDRILKKGDFDLQDEAKSNQIQKLKEKVSETSRLAAQRYSALREKELELDRLIKRLEGEEKSIASRQNAVKFAEPLSIEEGKTASDLHRQIDNLKAEINLQQHERRQLRKELREAQKKLRVRESRKTPTVPTDEQSAGLEFETTPKKIMIPEYTAAYRRSCEVAPSAVVAKSLQAATGFASHDKQIWRQTKGIETIPHIYRIRVGIHHRLMIQWEKEKGLKVLDLIPRAQLETWIRQRAM
jgi:hypothetical protein